MSDFESSFLEEGWEGDTMLLGMPLAEGWNRIMGMTPTGNTGPDAAFSGNYYAYMESGAPAPASSIFKINTPPVDLPLGSAVFLKFRTLLYGAGIGYLKVNVLSGPTFTTVTNIITITGNPPVHTSGDPSNWTEAFANLQTYGGETIKIEFEGMKMGSSSEGDLAIDQVMICRGPTIPTMGEWGITITFLLLAIFGVIAVRTKSPLAAS